MSVGDAFVALAVGLVAGAYSGLLGVGGGIIMVPAMVLLLSQSQHVAEGTSLLVIVPTAIAGTRASLRRGLVRRREALLLAAAGVAGAVGGAVVALEVIADERVLRRVFGGVLLAVAARLVVRPSRAARPAGPHPEPPS